MCCCADYPLVAPPVDYVTGDQLQAATVGLATNDAIVARRATVAAVRSMAALVVGGSRATALRTQGYYAPGDGGGTDYYADLADTVTADDGFSVLVDAAGVRWKKQFSGGLINILEAGAQSGTNCEAALNRVVAAFNANPLCAGIFFPYGTWDCSTEKVLTRGGDIVGASRNGTLIRATNATQNVFRVNTTGSVHFEKLAITSTVTKNAGAGILLDGNNGGSSVKNCIISAHFIGLDTGSASSWTFSGNYVVSCVQFGVRVRNLNTPDAGDSTIDGCTFATGLPTPAAIYQESSGGLRISNNKILGHQYGYSLGLADGVSTSILIVNGNSFEHQTVCAVSLSHAGATGTFALVLIEANEFTVDAVGIRVIGSRQFLNVLTIGASNQFSLGSGTKAVTLQQCTNVRVDGNFFGNNALTGIEAAATVDGIHYGRGKWAGTFSAGRISTSATNVTFDADVLTGTVTVTVGATATYGTLFAGTAPVVFPRPFNAVGLPVKVIAQGIVGGGGCVTGCATATTGTGFTATALGVTPSGVCTVEWRAEGRFV